MRVLVLWAHQGSANLGLHVLAEGTAALVKRVWPDCDIHFQDYGKGTAPMPLSSPKSLAKEWVTGNRGLKKWLQSFDLAIDTRSGDSFADLYGVERLFGMGMVAELVRRAGVPLVLGPQTIGPFVSTAGRALGRRSLNTATAVMSRDSASAAQAEILGRPVDARSTDVVFALPQPLRTAQRDVILNISGLLWAPGPHMDADHYRRTVASLYQELLREGRSVSLLAHVLDSPVADNDVPAIREFAAAHAPGAEVLIPTSLTHVRTLVASGNVVVGSRMHACLNALSSGTPAVALAYSRKFAPLFQDLGWNHTVDLRSHPDPVAVALAACAAPSLERQVDSVLAKAEDLLVVAQRSLESFHRDKAR
ncbi:polysaccharide pyruvyl transferase family protein [Pseudarthrobacter sp. PvP090]|uniref:polysaccharide pyruvyl transferase family protein n=1 Tax=Pseudarthrobacter sp. PvP090 TaxID=3156393 RepID=UPI003398D369